MCVGASKEEMFGARKGNGHGGGGRDGGSRGRACEPTGSPDEAFAVQIRKSSQEADVSKKESVQHCSNKCTTRNNHLIDGIDNRKQTHIPVTCNGSDVRRNGLTRSLALVRKTDLQTSSHQEKSHVHCGSPKS